MFDIQAHRHPNGQTESVESGDDIDDGHNEVGNATLGIKRDILTLGMLHSIMVAIEIRE